jgi:squalene synthase HpnC
VSDLPASLADAYAECEELARSHYENFPVASWLVPSAMRPHIAALYAFARVADDLADEGAVPADERRAGLDRWRAGLHCAAGAESGAKAAMDGIPAHSDASSCGNRRDRDARILLAAGHSIRTLALPMTLFDDLVDAFGQDIMTNRYDSWHQVVDYCRRSANPVGRLVLRIAGYHDDRLDRSSDALCTALQLTNFWQDLGTDWRIGRLYVPVEIMHAAGASEATLGGPTLTPEWAAAVESCVAFTRDRFAEGRLVCDGVAGRLRAELRFTWLGGMRVLDLVERGRFELLHRRPVLGVRDVPLLLWRAGFWRRESRRPGNGGRPHS